MSNTTQSPIFESFSILTIKSQSKTDKPTVVYSYMFKSQPNNKGNFVDFLKHNRIKLNINIS